MCFAGLVLALFSAGTGVWALGQADSTPKGDVISVDFWSAPNQGQFNYWSKMATEFNQKDVIVNSQKVRVTVQMMPETPSSEAGIQNALATGTAPAASENINRGFAATLATSERIYDVKNEAFFKEIIASRKMESVLTGWKINSNQYVIPRYANAMGYHWNVKALKALGFTNWVPETQEDIKALVTAFYKLQKTTMKDMGVSHIFVRPQLLRPDQWWERWFDFQMQYLAFSGGKDWVTGNKLTLDKSFMKDTFEFFGMFGSSLQTAEDWTAFERETVPAVVQLTAPWDVPKYIVAGKVYGFDGDYVYGPPIVKKAGDVPFTFADSKGIVFYKGGNVTDAQHAAIIEFIKWVFIGERGIQGDIDWVKTTGMLPVRGDLLSNPVFKDVLATNPSFAYQAKIMPNAIPAMAHDKMTDIQPALGEAGLTPYIQSVASSTTAVPPSAELFVEKTFAAMKKAGKLD